MSRILSTAVLIACAALAQAAPAPLPKPDRQGPTLEAIVMQLKRQGSEVRRIQSAGSGNWVIVTARLVNVRSGLIGSRLVPQKVEIEEAQRVAARG